MTRTPHDAPPLRIVGGNPEAGALARGASPDADGGQQTTRDVDWSILMARAQAGDANAYLRLLNEMVPYVRGLAARKFCDADVIEDAVQDVLLTIHAIRHTYDPARPFGPWLVAIVNRRLVDLLRRQGRWQARTAPLDPEQESLAASPENPERDLDRQGLHGAIGHLPPTQKQAIELLKLKEMSLKEAANVSGLSVAALKVATHRAIRNLRRMLADRDDGGRS